MRRLLVVLLVGLVLLVALDRVAAALAERAVAAQVRATGALAADPAVSIGGFPFLTQALRGRYDRVQVSASGLRGEQGVTAFRADLAGVHVPLTAALSGRVDQVPVDRVQARVVLGYRGLEQRIGERRLRLAPAGDLLRVTGSVQVLGRTLSASALSTVRLDGPVVRVTAQRFEVGARPADRVLSAALGGRLDFTVRLRRLPYGLSLTSVTVQPDGLVATATGRNAVLR